MQLLDSVYIPQEKVDCGCAFKTWPVIRQAPELKGPIKFNNVVSEWHPGDVGLTTHERIKERRLLLDCLFLA